MKFHRAVLPGEQIHLRAEKLAQVGDLVQFAVKATIAGTAVAEGQLSCRSHAKTIDAPE
jgi:3-hydroxymyristoyl/3-hydroxydecanoyl-(acyl carrier protein) dehydratase